MDRIENAEGVGNIGFIAYDDPTALAAAIRQATCWLADNGVRVMRCPVQLSTWFGHRATVAGLNEPTSPKPFLFEPTNPTDLAAILQAMGFSVAHRAQSRCVDNERAIAGTERCVGLMRATGLSERPLLLAALDSELALLHRLATAIFRESWGYADIAADEFIAFYRPLASVLDPELVRFLLGPDGEPVGFVFAYPDPGGCFVLKTIGVLPEVRRSWPGVGSALIAIVHRLAREKGYHTGIHAFMAEGSYAQRTSARWGSWMRSYATFERAGVH
jgi:hypothetical protein